VPPTGNGSSIQDRAAASPAVDPQEGMFDKQINDQTLEAALEERERLRQQKLEAEREYKTADKAAKDQLVGFELALGEVARIGRFRIKKVATAPRSVSFDTAGSERLDIKVGD
jgi:hypothetical protein